MTKIKPLILAIDTSCDETAAAVSWGRRILSNVVWSQIEVHRPWGGVVPDLARREHRRHLTAVIARAIKNAEKTRKRFRLSLPPINWQSIDFIAVTQGPGLAIALEVGIRKAKELAQKYQKKLLAINHMEGHLLSPFALNAKGKGPLRRGWRFPALGLLVSGGHTQLVLMKDFGQYQLLGETLDDAAGEAFDKVAKMLNLGYPGGPVVEELAKEGNPRAFSLPVPMLRHRNLNFSYSGLKTACLYCLRALSPQKRSKKFYQDFAASFQHTLALSLTKKLERAIKQVKPRLILAGGGVISNLYVRRQLRTVAKKYNLSFFTPYRRDLLTDNAAMIAIAAYYQAQKGIFVKNPQKLDRQPNLNFPRQE